MFTRRKFGVGLGCASLALSGFTSSANAQQLELSKILVGFPPGGSTDNVARRLAEKLKGSFASNILVDNKPGAGAQIAVTTLKDSASNGSVMLLSPGSPFTIYPFTYKKLPYSPSDVVPVSLVSSFSFALAVGPAVPDSVKNLNDFIRWVKANPSAGNFGSPATGSPTHLLGALLGKIAGIELAHVAYRGDGPGIQDLMGGQVAAYSSVLGSFLPYLKSGKLRLIAITGQGRNSFVPDLPTYREQGFAIDYTEWFGVFLPAKTPDAIIQTVSNAIQNVCKDQEFIKGLAEFGMQARGSSPQELFSTLKADSDAWRSVVTKLGFTADS
jgi:tripartite-type tricarboxylate transporter receptor subunit TctC